MGRDAEGAGAGKRLSPALVGEAGEGLPGPARGSLDPIGRRGWRKERAFGEQGIPRFSVIYTS